MRSQGEQYISSLSVGNGHTAPCPVVHLWALISELHVMLAVNYVAHGTFIKCGACLQEGALHRQVLVLLLLRSHIFGEETTFHDFLVIVVIILVKAKIGGGSLWCEAWADLWVNTSWGRCRIKVSPGSKLALVRPDIWRDLTLHVTILLVSGILFISILVHLIIDDLLKLLLSKVMLLLLEVFTFWQEISLKLLELSNRGSVGELVFLMFV